MSRAKLTRAETFAPLAKLKAEREAKREAKQAERDARQAKLKTEREAKQAENEAKRAEREATFAKAQAAYEAKGKQISVMVDKINREEDAAIDAYNKHAGASTTYREELATLLRDAEPLCEAARMTVKQMKKRYIGDRLGNTQFKQLLRVARGGITFQEIKEQENARKREQNARKQAAAAAAAAAAAEAAAAAAAEAADLEAKPVRATGSQEIDIEQRKTDMAEHAGEDTHVKNAPSITPEEQPASHAASGDTKQVKKGSSAWYRGEFLTACRTYLPKLGLVDIRGIEDHFAAIVKPLRERLEAAAAEAIKKAA